MHTVEITSYDRGQIPANPPEKTIGFLGDLLTAAGCAIRHHKLGQVMVVDCPDGESITIERTR